MRIGILILVALACAAGEPKVTVFAAASTTNALKEIADAYMKANPGLTVVCNVASSSALARQIEQGAPADIFIAADQDWMDRVEKAGLLKVGSRRDLLANRLVLIAPAGAGRQVEITVARGFDIAAAFQGRFAIGDPATVPIGKYAKEAFTKLGWWAALEPRLAPAQDVRAAMRLVELGEAGLGVVYASDARISQKVMAVADIPQDLHTPVRYPLALLARAGAPAEAFAAYLAGAEAAQVWRKLGFALAGQQGAEAGGSAR